MNLAIFEFDKPIHYYGVEFVVPFSSHSRPLALKLPLESHQMTTCFVQNDKVFTEIMLISNSIFEHKSCLLTTF